MESNNVNIDRVEYEKSENRIKYKKYKNRKSKL